MAASDVKLQALIDVLKDDASRKVLLDELNSMVAKTDGPTAEAPARAPISLARQVAEFTQDLAQSASTLIAKIWRDMQGLNDALTSGDIDLVGLATNNLVLIGTIITTFAALIVLRLLARPLYARMAEGAHDLGFAGTGLWLLGSVIVDALFVFLAFAVGYGLAIGLFGALGEVTVNQSLYLNAFLLVELVKNFLRGVLAPGFAGLRLLPINDRTARFAYGRSAWITSILGYGILVVTPIVNAQITPAVGRGVTVLAMIIALILALRGIWRLKTLLQDETAMNGADEDITSRALGVIDRVWPWLATLYALGVFVIGVSRPADVMPFVLAATGKSVLAIAGGVALVTLIGRTTRSGVPLPARLKQDLPLLGRRLNRVVPRFLQILRFVVLLAVTLIVADSWGLLDVGGWLSSPDGEALTGGLLSAFAILAVAYLIWLAIMSWIEYRLSDTLGPIAGARQKTLLSLLGNAVTIFLAALGTMLALSELGIDIGPLLAGAGVIGLAVGFGAQSLVQDIITGVFIQFENAINTGDVVTVAGVTGTVERLSVRSIGIRDLAGTYHLIPFSTVDSVANFNRGFAYHVAEIGIAYKESVADAKDGMAEAFNRLKETELSAAIVADLEMQGVTALGDSAIVVRARIRTQPGQQWAIGRAYNELVKQVFDERDIEIPFPHMTVFMGIDKAGKTQLDPMLPGGQPSNS
ncbi:MAG: mechanosensitive ion channel domain-containing protein [Pseudomonadota bacterium]